MGKSYEYLKVGELRKQLEGVDDDDQVFIRCCHNICGNIVEAGIADKSTYGFFGDDVPCIIIEPADPGFKIKRG